MLETIFSVRFARRCGQPGVLRYSLAEPWVDCVECEARRARIRENRTHRAATWVHCETDPASVRTSSFPAPPTPASHTKTTQTAYSHVSLPHNVTKFSQGGSLSLPFRPSLPFHPFYPAPFLPFCVSEVKALSGLSDILSLKDCI